MMHGQKNIKLNSQNMVCSAASILLETRLPPLAFRSFQFATLCYITRAKDNALE